MRDGREIESRDCLTTTSTKPTFATPAKLAVASEPRRCESALQYRPGHCKIHPQVRRPDHAPDRQLRNASSLRAVGVIVTSVGLAVFRGKLVFTVTGYHGLTLPDESTRCSGTHYPASFCPRTSLDAKPAKPSFPWFMSCHLPHDDHRHHCLL